MNIYVDLPEDNEGPEFVEVEGSEHRVATITDLQKVAKIIWPKTDIERIWLTPATFLKGIRLTNVDITDIHDNQKLQGIRSPKEHLENIHLAQERVKNKKRGKA